MSEAIFRKVAAKDIPQIVADLAADGNVVIQVEETRDGFIILYNTP